MGDALRNAVAVVTSAPCAVRRYGADMLGSHRVGVYRLRVLEPIDPHRYYSTADVADRVRVGVDTLEDWRAKGYGPRWHSLPVRRVGDLTAEGRRAVPRYAGRDVIAWLEQCAVETRGPLPPGARSKPRMRR